MAGAEGLAALSMQRVAGELGFTKMALYRHVSGKAELIAVMIEEAVGVRNTRPVTLGRHSALDHAAPTQSHPHRPARPRRRPLPRTERRNRIRRNTPDKSREFGLQRLLDGLEILIDQRTG
ncbi:TetR family transcriptional regulator [Actinomadura sp. 6N118]|uniref:TetR family transcriptional regulator n=1 Tax=Actinomadura sp. 6N118 TaxID=3375151 RepID=UPI003787FB84